MQRLLTRAAIWGLVLLASWGVASFFLVAVPAVDQPEQSDAVVVLAPAVPTGRLDYATKLMSEGYSPVLVISVPVGESGNPPADICEAHMPYRVICFSPDPATTQGEARAIQKLSDENNWHHVTVVTDDSHVSRARTIIGRCYSRKLDMIAVRPDLSPINWTYRFVYESAAFVKAAVDWEC
ncbi:uncharacterized SAM-binding protein YcdF (DUF218 family) [Arthrobacter sp. B2I5]|nr:uncharacterized SAM-binding protein YcdF (DUF218 family) [Arthrobacter sp. B2I5]